MEENNIYNLFKDELAKSQLMNNVKDLREENANINDIKKCTFCNLNFLVRKNYSSSDYKVFELTSWQSNYCKFCIVCGFNPTNTSINEIDNTNQKLFSILNKKGYQNTILINNHIQKSKDKESYFDDDNDIKYYQQLFLKFLEIVEENKVDLVIFWGRTSCFNNNIKDKLIQIMNNGRLYITVKKGTSNHYHPARVDIDIIKAKIGRAHV